VSRKAVDLLFFEFLRANSDDNIAFYEHFRELPSVIPTRKKGKWIKEMSLLGWDGCSYQCSECGRSIHLDTEVEDLIDYPYCHCGVEMEIEEEMESEELIH
jgi:hypothetical protein